MVYPFKRQKETFRFTLSCNSTSSNLLQESQEFLVDIYGLVFWFDSVRAMHQVNQKCSRPLAIWSFLQEYRGLSRMGNKINSAVHISLPMSLQDRYKQKWFQAYQTKLDSYIAENTGIFATDNFSHKYKLSGPDMQYTVPYVATNWTVNAFQCFDDRKLAYDFNFKFLPDETVVPTNLAVLQPFFKKVNKILL